MDEGTRGVMAQAVEAAAGEIDELRRVASGEQLSLIPVATRNTGAEGLALDLAIAEHHGPGRPPGAVNRATKEFRDYLLARGVSPLVQMMRWSLHTPDTLARELSCTRYEAFVLLKSLWSELAPYMHQRLPLAVEVDARSAGVLILGTISAEQRADLATKFGVAGLTLANEETQQNQALLAPAPDVSHEEKSHDDEKL